MGWKKGISAPAWVNPEMEKYNNDVIKGIIPCPYKVQHHVFQHDIKTNVPLRPQTQLFKKDK